MPHLIYPRYPSSKFPRVFEYVEDSPRQCIRRGDVYKYIGMKPSYTKNKLLVVISRFRVVKNIGYCKFCDYGIEFMMLEGDLIGKISRMYHTTNGPRVGKNVSDILNKEELYFDPCSQCSSSNCSRECKLKLERRLRNICSLIKRDINYIG